jgi:hypothetical protein
MKYHMSNQQVWSRWCFVQKYKAIEIINQYDWVNRSSRSMVTKIAWSRQSIIRINEGIWSQWWLSIKRITIKNNRNTSIEKIDRNETHPIKSWPWMVTMLHKLRLQPVQEVGFWEPEMTQQLNRLSFRFEGRYYCLMISKVVMKAKNHIQTKWCFVMSIKCSAKNGCTMFDCLQTYK